MLAFEKLRARAWRHTRAFCNNLANPLASPAPRLPQPYRSRQLTQSVPLASRNLPASFFNAAACGAGGAGGPGGPGAPGCGLELYEYDPWHQPYGYARDYQHVGYGGLLLGRGGLHAQYKPVEWGAQHAHLDPAACAPYSYPAVPGQ
ncbi:hypothetical protein RR46_08706 [Papilio xuthus]|uniref:Uncharacterized protein n=1 Tax=Papilio xuthus TaxID=66420 RepID=A0A194Q8E7_PAPXU|nr:hypothetical protein RR46_08706 [Papilio xuthus]